MLQQQLLYTAVGAFERKGCWAVQGSWNAQLYSESAHTTNNIPEGLGRSRFYGVWTLHIFEALLKRIEKISVIS